MSAIEFVILALAVWRVSHMLSMEDGPGDVFERVRRAAGVVESVNGHAHAESVLGRLLMCPLCLSVWIAAVFFGVVATLPVLWPAFYILALSGASCIIEIIIMGRRQ